MDIISEDKEEMMRSWIIMVAALVAGVFAGIPAVETKDLMIAVLTLLVLTVTVGFGLQLTTSLPYVAFSAAKEGWQRFLYGNCGYALIGLVWGYGGKLAYNWPILVAILIALIVLGAIGLSIFNSAAQSNLERVRLLLAGSPANDATRKAAMLASKYNPEGALELLNH